MCLSIILLFMYLLLYQRSDAYTDKRQSLSKCCLVVVVLSHHIGVLTKQPSNRFMVGMEGLYSKISFISF